MTDYLRLFDACKSSMFSLSKDFFANKYAENGSINKTVVLIFRHFYSYPSLCRASAKNASKSLSAATEGGN
jgi:hypothetical protein